MNTRIEYSPLIQIQEGQYKNFLLYGKSGVGKTTSIATMDESVLVINQEKRLGSLKSQFKSNPNEMDRYTVINTYESENLCGTLSDIYQMLLNNGSLPKWIVMDSLTVIARTILKGILSGTSKGGNSVHGMAAYGECQKIITEIFESFCALPTNFVAICHLARHTDTEGMSFLAPALPGKALPESVAYPFDCVYFLDRTVADKDGNSKRFFQVEPDARAAAKNCMNMGARIEPNFSAVLNHILR